MYNKNRFLYTKNKIKCKKIEQNEAIEYNIQPKSRF